MKALSSKISSILVIIFCFVFCKSCTSDYFKGRDTGVIENYEQMLSDNTIAEAELSSNYTEESLKVKSAVVSKSFLFNYTFFVNEIKYTGKYSFSQLPTTNTVQVYYLKTNPSINSKDPKKALETEKASHLAINTIIPGIGWGLVGILTLFGMIKKKANKDNIS